MTSPQLNFDNKRININLRGSISAMVVLISLTSKFETERQVINITFNTAGIVIV